MKVKVRIKFDSVWRTDIILVPHHLMEKGLDVIYDWLYDHFRSKGANKGARVKPPVMFYIISAPA